MPVIYLVRHAQGSFGTADYDVLSALGVRQAAVIGAELARRGVGGRAVAVSGDLTRQRETAELAGVDVGFGSEVRIDPGWNEFDARDLAVASPASGESSAAFQGRLDAALLAWIRSDESSWDSFRERTWSAFADLSAGLSSGEVGLAFTSGGVIAAIASVVWDLRAQAVVSLNRVLVNGSITTVIVGAGGSNLLSVNDHAHLLVPGSGLLTYR